MSMLVSGARTLLTRGSVLLFTNSVELVRVQITTTLVSGTPRQQLTVTDARWSGKGSLQYVRPRIQKPFADVVSGTHEDPIAFVAYLPFAAAPTTEDHVRDVDGVIGDAGTVYKMSRRPANVGGLSVYWEVYLGGATNA